MARKKDSQSEALPFETANPREVFARIRNYLAGRMLGATRDRALLGEVIKCLLSFYLEGDLAARGAVKSDLDASKWYRSRFAKLRDDFPGLFRPTEEIQLDPAALLFVHRQFETLRIEDAERDPIGDAYETFVGSALRGEEGQFFTPLNAVKLLVEMVAPSRKELVVDPACGAGGFLVTTALRWRREGGRIDPDLLVGVDKDDYLAQLTRARLALLLRRPGRTVCADSLDWGHGDPAFPLASIEGQVDVVLTNPPFGVKIVAGSEHVHRDFALAKKWRSDPDGRWSPTAEAASSAPPQVLFVERCIRLLKTGGRLGAIVPESLISGKSYRQVTEYLQQQGRVLAVVGLPEAMFKTSGKGGTHTKTAALVFEKTGPDQRASRRPVFMAEARWCGHDSRGRTMERDDLPVIAARYAEHAKGKLAAASSLGFGVRPGDLEPGVLAPRFYDHELAAMIEELAKTHDMVTVRELVDAGVLEITTGDEIGKLSYGTGDVPFVRTSDFSNWEIKRDPKHLVSAEIFESIRRKQDVRERDILMVRDGTYLIGTCAIVTRFDTRIVFQSHIYKLRVRKEDQLNPYLLLATLSSSPVQRQIRARCLSQDIIDSLGDRIYDLQLPIPRDPSVRRRISELVGTAVEDRIVARELGRRACEAIMNPGILDTPVEAGAAPQGVPSGLPVSA